MTAQILTSELSTLIADSKRKLPDLRNAAEKSLQDLKSLPTTSEAQLSADLARKPQFIEPFLIACTSKNGRFAGTGVSCLQRLAVSGGLPKARLREILDAVRECSTLGVDVQLKVLQTLPSILQNYPGEIRSGLLFSLLQTCSILQSSKTATINSTAAATFQQVLSTLFEGLVKEDAKTFELPTTAEVTGTTGAVQVRPVAFDAFRVFQDVCLLAEGKKPIHIKFSPLPEASALELVEAILASYSDSISAHDELAHIIKSSLLPFLISSFKEKRPFPITVRVSRLLYMIVRNHNHLFPEECGQILECFNHVLDQNEGPSSWKRILCLEIYRGIFMESSLVLQIYYLYDQQPDSKLIVRGCTASFVRLASEKPAVIGLSQQSTIPVGNYFQRESSAHASEEAVSAAIGAEGTAGVGTSAVPGISHQWSSVRSPFIDQLDKLEPPPLPETYAYSLVLLCLNNLAESLAKFILPLTVHQSAKAKKRGKQQFGTEEALDQPVAEFITEPQEASGLKRTPSYKRKTVPANPLTLQSHPAYQNIQTVAALIDQCWPAILASCSTFFYASLDSDHYRALVRSFQKFTQVAGLLRMPTPRDAFLTTLGKAAVPAHVLAATFTSPSTAVAQSPSLLRSATGLLNVENLVNQASTLLPDRARPNSLETAENTLSSRNLLCLRALLNLAIALGPTLEASWSIVFETLQQADKIMATVNLRPVSRDSRPAVQIPTQSQNEFPQSQILASEVSAIQAAAVRLFESTADYPNDSFTHLLRALCSFVDPRQVTLADTKSPPSTPGGQHRRVSSFSGMSTKTDVGDKDIMFALSKIRELAAANVERFANYEPSESGWRIFTSTATWVATQPHNPSTARMVAADLLCRMTRDIVTLVGTAEVEKQNEIHIRSLSALSTLCIGLDAIITEANVSPDDTSFEVHSIALETLRAILEQTGDLLSDGWAIVFDVLYTAFDLACQENVGSHKKFSTPAAALKTVALGRSAFGSVQLICSDFLRSVPDNSLLTLIDIIYHFAAQGRDLNMSLTATALFWNLSDLLYGRLTPEHLDELSSKAVAKKDTSSLLDFLLAEAAGLSIPALWTLLLCQVRDTAADPREEVRTGATHTLVRIFENNGDDLTSNAWRLNLEAILLPLLHVDAESFGSASKSLNDEQSELKARVTTSKLILEGVGKLFATYINAITQCTTFDSLWDTLTDTFKKYLSWHQYDLTEAVFQTITTILTPIVNTEQIGKSAVGVVAAIWAQAIPASGSASLSGTNQETFQAYVRTLRQIYRLNESEVTVDVIRGIVNNLGQLVRKSQGSAYSSDADSMTRLQKEILDTLLLLRTDIEGAPSAILELLSNLISLPFEMHEKDMVVRKPTFIAVSKESMGLASSFVLRHLDRDEIYQESLLKTFQALEIPISLKYTWKLQGKRPVLWQTATTTLLAVIERTVPRMFSVGLEDTIVHAYWETIVRAGKGIASANVDVASDEAPIFDDEDFDVDALSRFHDLIIPALGSASIPDTSRRAYARALFDSSVIHVAEDEELPDLDTEPLKDVYKIRFGRTYDPEPTLRGAMAYHCLSDLVALLSKHDTSPERVKLAKAAAPYLILRAALPLKAYIADQPLRGRYMPQPASQRQELLFILKSVRELESENQAIPETEGVKTMGKRHLVRLYGLVVKAVEVAGRTAKPDTELIGELRSLLESVVEEFKV